jgi:Asp-tRNA(Asn)/Glu-tRNA(Gln) amidotransferase A subunit family amidase
MRVLWASDFGWDKKMSQEVVDVARRSALRMRDAGAVVEEGDLPFDIVEMREAWVVLNDVERYTFLTRGLLQDLSARTKLSATARRYAANGAKISASEYVLAAKLRYRLIDQMNEVFEKHDLIITPTMGTAAPAVPVSSDEVPDYVGAAPASEFSGINYVFHINLSGFAAVSVPCGFVNGLPVGMQIIGRYDDEARILRAARAFEQVQPWDQHRPIAAV